MDVIVRQRRCARCKSIATGSKILVQYVIDKLPSPDKVSLTVTIEVTTSAYGTLSSAYGAHDSVNGSMFAHYEERN